ncbi:tetratricopeptide repeat protein [Shewanella gelidii]|uniref:Tetratricopeptide repeat protein n=1 Tax=Shewanella gelidii TaxID=1642821 RepID=A0A917JNQ6_9GAMM|nr:hypothetical protein [Shewanella gelidii]MCL1097808.1 hypothetical protein [Shewanella gelidii]GGI78605.1 hypothetical protein GCM10009332_15000 [Shewanella gelidii]
MRNLFRLSLGLCCLVWIVGCASHKSNHVTAHEVNQLFHDAYFSSVEGIPTPEQLFELPASVKNEVRRKYTMQKRHSVSALEENEWLANYINASQGGFAYRDNITRVASETYADREGNCLSLVLLTAALAETLNINVEFQEVDVPPVWDKQGQFYFVNGHINLRLNSVESHQAVSLRKTKILIDFLPERAVRGYAKREVDRQTVIAMFYNNMAAESLVHKHYDRAYALLKQSLNAKPDFVPAINNLAVIYRHKSLLEASESAYKFALNIAPKQLNTLFNYAVLLGSQNRLEEWAEVHRVLELSRINNPYYYFDIAQQAYFDKEYREAILWYKRAVEKADYRHEFYFGLSRTYWATGDKKRAKKNMQKALALTGDLNSKKRYQAKLHAMKAH